MHILALLFALISIGGFVYAFVSDYRKTHSGRQFACVLGAFILGLICTWGFFGKVQPDFFDHVPAIAWTEISIFFLAHSALLYFAYLWKDPKGGNINWNPKDDEQR